MALIIEDGSIVAGAQSYNTAEELRDYASLRGIVVSANDQTLEQHLIRAMDAMESFRDEYAGEQVNASQSLQWPRVNVCIDSRFLPSGEIPREIKYAQLAFAVESLEGHDLLQNPVSAGSSNKVKRKKLKNMEIEYFENGGSVMHVSAFAKPRALIAPFLKKRGLFLVRA